MSEKIPNKQYEKQYEELQAVLESTIEVQYSGGSQFILTARDDEFWNSVFNDLRRHNWEVQKHISGEMWVKKVEPDPRRETDSPTRR